MCSPAGANGTDAMQVELAHNMTIRFRCILPAPRIPQAIRMSQQLKHQRSAGLLEMSCDERISIDVVVTAPAPS